MKHALITGVSGQDGSYLAEFLLENEYEVHGLTRDPKKLPDYFKPLLKNKYLHLHKYSLQKIKSLIHDIQFDEFYHLASPTNVRQSLEEPAAFLDAIAGDTSRILNTLLELSDPPKFLNASSGDMFGASEEDSPHTEESPLRPITPYGAAKVCAYQMTTIHRNAFNLPACSAIPFSHESPRRKPHAVSRKIAQSVVRIKNGLQDKLILNNLTAKRDWGWAPDYVEAMWLILQQDELDDYILATGKCHSLKEIAQAAFDYVGLDCEKYLTFNPNLMPIVEIPTVAGNPAKIKEKMGWQPSVIFPETMKRLIDVEMQNPDNHPSSK